MLGLSSESAPAQRRFAEQQAVSYPLLLGTRPMPAPYGQVAAVPTTFVIDRRGVLRETIVGYRQGRLERLVAQLLRERGPAATPARS
jgi:peroxiredoxin